MMVSMYGKNRSNVTILSVNASSNKFHIWNMYAMRIAFLRQIMLSFKQIHILVGYDIVFYTKILGKMLVVTALQITQISAQTDISTP